MRTTVGTGERPPTSVDARACRPTRLRRHSPHACTAVLLAVVVAACTSSRPAEVAWPSDRLARVVATRTLGLRQRDLTIDSPALGRTAMVRLLLPRGFQTQPNRRWPVLWLLHGCCDSDAYQSWTLWAAHNPYDLALRLRGVGLFVSVGNGQPGPLDRPESGGDAQEIEQALYPQNTAFVARLRRLGIPVRFDNYGPGSHDWPYWQRELHRSLPLLLAALQQH